MTHVAVAYLRVSTQEQDLGPEAQRAAIQMWAERQGVRVVVTAGSVLDADDSALLRLGAVIVALRHEEPSSVVACRLTHQLQFHVREPSGQSGKPGNVGQSSPVHVKTSALISRR